MSANFSRLLERIAKRSGHKIQLPTPEEAKAHLAKIGAEANAEQYDRFSKQQRDYARNKALGGSFLPVRYQECTFDNYEIYAEGQVQALNFARTWTRDFIDDQAPTSFVFSGTTGTGKNHLAAAMCMEIIENGGLAKLITVNELDQLRRSRCFGPKADLTEIDFLAPFVNVDLLILDEVGLSTNSLSQKVFVDHLVNDRANKDKPTGLISNLQGSELSQHLGERIVDRIATAGGHWITFNWKSNRTRK
ncbi:ATP-binding protein [Vibrio harveyi]|uniref:ATP-binding protein n=1 Tax=Vibrio harveyi TaxID=669 RepID=UPI0025B064D8|nr:ATP-binding protein [Vibrio harveyi]WJT09243.1 ATP-binding protein [Vibrio harveyi]